MNTRTTLKEVEVHEHASRIPNKCYVDEASTEKNRAQEADASRFFIFYNTAIKRPG